jgi:PIN domain nuclease of toxin-antitoxin system
MKILLDTHIWLWNLAGNKKLPKRFRDVLSDKKTEVWLSPISVWEALALAEKNKIRITSDPSAWIDEALRRWSVNEAPLTIDVAIKSKQLDLLHHDPADRFIAATALIYNLRLMTVDERLTSVLWLPTVG